MELVRHCRWCNAKNPKYVAYHDNEWGRPTRNEQALYETLMLESFQAGLSWECVLNKREGFRAAFDGFSLDRVCEYGEQRIEALCMDRGIIRHRAKINACIQNSRVFQTILDEYGSFYTYLSAFTGGEILYEIGKTTNAVSDAISRDLRSRGMKFIGSITVYSYLQAIGMICSHERDCFLYHEP